MRIVIWGVVAWLVVVLVGCVQPIDAQLLGQTALAPPGQISEVQLSRSGGSGGRLLFGEACTQSPDCLSRICLHVDVRSRLAGRVCTERCGGSVDCPGGSWCRQVYPTDDAWFCVAEVTP